MAQTIENILRQESMHPKESLHFISTFKKSLTQCFLIVKVATNLCRREKHPGYFTK